MSLLSRPLSPITRRRLAVFRGNRRARVSLWLFAGLFVLSLLAELIANDRPIVMQYQGAWYVPLLVDYPDYDEERTIVDMYTAGAEQVPVERSLTRSEIQEIQQLVREMPIADDLRDRAVQLVRRTREADDIEFGASPRASMALVQTAKARAFLHGRSHVTGEDIEALAAPVLRHRIIVDFRAERAGRTADDLIAALME